MAEGVAGAEGRQGRPQAVPRSGIVTLDVQEAPAQAVGTAAERRCNSKGAEIRSPAQQRRGVTLWRWEPTEPSRNGERQKLAADRTPGDPTR